MATKQGRRGLKFTVQEMESMLEAIDEIIPIGNPGVYSNSTIIPDSSKGVCPENIGPNLSRILSNDRQSKPIIVIYAWSFRDASNFHHGDSASGISAHRGIFWYRCRRSSIERLLKKSFH
jgi:hypothetical protein